MVKISMLPSRGTSGPYLFCYTLLDRKFWCMRWVEIEPLTKYSVYHVTVTQKNVQSIVHLDTAFY